jgi:protocatechuate 4,5-dioxygenase alpha chain
MARVRIPAGVSRHVTRHLRKLLKLNGRMHGTKNALTGVMSVQPEERLASAEAPVFDGKLAMKGYALNKMCFSFNDRANREAFRRDEDAYCARFGLTEEQRRAVKSRNVLALLDAGGNIYYLAKWAGIFGLNVQDLGAQQRGMTVEEFIEMLIHAGGR